MERARKWMFEPTMALFRGVLAWLQSIDFWFVGRGRFLVHTQNRGTACQLIRIGACARVGNGIESVCPCSVAAPTLEIQRRDLCPRTLGQQSYPKVRLIVEGNDLVELKKQEKFHDPLILGFTSDFRTLWLSWCSNEPHIGLTSHWPTRKTSMCFDMWTAITAKRTMIQADSSHSWTLWLMTVALLLHCTIIKSRTDCVFGTWNKTASTQFKRTRYEGSVGCILLFHGFTRKSYIC